MDRPARVTNPLLDVLTVLLEAFDNNSQELHGWAIMKATGRSGPTVYGVLDRLEDADWIAGRWEDHNPQPNKPRRRFYRLTPDGVVSASRLLSARRSAVSTNTARRARLGVHQLGEQPPPPECAR